MNLNIHSSDADYAVQAHAHTGNGVAWTLMIGGLCLMPFTSGLSFAATLMGGLMLRSPNPSEPDESINDMALTAKAATGAAGGTGCLFAWLTLITIGIGMLIFVALAMTALGGGQ